MSDDAAGLQRLREAVLDDEHLVRAVLSGVRRGEQLPWRRVELRLVDLKAGRHLQVVAFDDTQSHTSNHAVGAEAAAEVDRLMALPFNSWHVETTTHTHQLRWSKKGRALVSSSARTGDAPAAADRAHDRQKPRLLDPADPLWHELGLADQQGRIKPSRQAKWRQVEEFCRVLDDGLRDGLAAGHLRTPTPDHPLVVVDLGCGNGYLTFAAHRVVSRVHGLPVRVVGVDSKQQSADHNRALAQRLGLAAGEAQFVVGTIWEGDLPDDTASPDVVLALHACDTATDEALARAVGWGAGLVLAAPCCHHDVAAQLRRRPTPDPWSMVTRHGILRERLADTLTDALRAALLRLRGYRVDVMEFVPSEHTPRNSMLRAVRTGAAPAAQRREYEQMVEAWEVRPALAELLEAGRP